MNKLQLFLKPICYVFLSMSMVASDFRFVSIDKCECSNCQRLSVENCAFDKNGLNFTYHVKIGTNVTNVQIEILMKGKRDKNFKKVIKTPTIEWCSFIARPDRDPNPLVRMILQILKATIPALYDNQCPWEMKIDVVHMRIPKQYTIILPAGLYQYKAFIHFPTRPMPASVRLCVTFEIF